MQAKSALLPIGTESLELDRKPAIDQSTEAKLIFVAAAKQVEPYLGIALKNLLKSDSDNSDFLTLPVLELVNRGGKRIRPVLGVLIASCIGWPIKHRQTTLNLVVGVQLLHNASLVVDDIEDGRQPFEQRSQKRRDKPCVHKIYGTSRSLVSSNYCYFKVMQGLLPMIPEHMKAGLLEVYFEEMMLSHVGQAQDLCSHHLTFTNKRVFIEELPSEEQYIRMVVSKTGSLLRLMTREICVLYEAEASLVNSFVQIVENLAICFQIRDDIINLQSEMGKGIKGEDLLQRKVTLMILYTVRQLNDIEFLTMFLKETKSSQELTSLIGVLSSNGSIEYAEQVFERYAEATMRLFEGLPNSPKMRQLKLVVRMIVYRKA